MKEWSNNLNSFNSLKGLLYMPWYKAIKQWKEHKGIPLPPVEVSLDPIHACNLKCSHCNAASYLISNLAHRKIDDSHLLKLIDFLSSWGALAICWGGGGEPTMHPKLSEALVYAKNKGLDNSIATNGTLFTPELIKAMAETCRWVGISVDAATPETYAIGRKVNKFNDTISNMKKLVREVNLTNSKCDVAYKFLIFDYNQHEIFEACRLAKEIGVKDFHVRPADWSHQGMGKDKKEVNPYNIGLIEEQFKLCHELEDDKFKVYTIVHKFDKNFIPRKDFSQCYASPCCIQLCADGSIYLCPDQRHNEKYKLGLHYPDPSNIKKIWGGNKHYDLVFKTGKNNCNTRCTFSPYCKQCEELAIKENDPFCWKFI